jgi:hypothetical protein
MRYRKLDANGDYSFGQGQSNFWIDQPEAVAQSVFTRLMLWTNQWFLDLEDGTDWAHQVLGERTRTTRDVVVRNRVQTTLGVLDMLAYGSVMDGDRRTWTAQMTLVTVYGPAELAAGRLPTTAPPVPGVDYSIGAPSAAQPGLLGITSGSTPMGMTPADLSQEGQADISNFSIRTVDGGRFA